MTIDLRSGPIMILSLAFSKSTISTTRPLRRAANSAASLTRLARSAPEKPRVTLGAHHGVVLGLLEVDHLDDPAVAPRREQRRLVDQVGEIGAREARRAA